MARNLGRLGSACLGVYLLLQGLVQLAGLHFTGMGILLGALALVAGVLLLAGR